jgi:phosphatidylserine decarboxylase
MLKTILVPIHREGRIFVLLFAAVTILLWWLTPHLGAVGLIATAWCVYFFRDPTRVTPRRPGIVVAPADGVVLPIRTLAPPVEVAENGEAQECVAIFMNVFDVHVNRIPADGTIDAVDYRPGKFFNASLDKASVDNERTAVRMTTGAGHCLVFVQIAGLVARRIVNGLEAGQAVIRGDRFGIIRFGSRVDVYLDPAYEPLVEEGQRTIAGETVIARLKSEV